MKAKLFYVLFISTLINFTSCKKETNNSSPKPEANFTYNGANTFAPAEVSFIDNSTNASSYQWDFGDNTYSTEKNPKHTYVNGGTYTVTLKVIGDGGNATVSKTVNINNKPTSCKIKKLYVLSFPFTDPTTGAGWDSNDGPDVYFQFIDTNNNNNAVLLDTKDYRIQNVTQSMLPIYWSWNSGSYWNIPTLNDYLFIDLWDYDPYSNNDYIGYVSYNMSNYMTVQNHYPDEIILNQNNISIKLEIVWQ